MVAVFALLAAACSGEQALGDPSSAGGSFGLVAVQFGHDLGAATPIDPNLLELNATAQFIRYAAFERERVAHLLALPVHPKVDLPELDSCRVFEQEAVLSEAEADGDADGYVDLIEAGELEVDTGTERVNLEPRYFPGLLPFISGVIYGEVQLSRIGQPGLVSAGLVSARAAGSDAVGAFRVSGASPEPVLLEARPEPGQLVSRSANLALRWRPAATPRPDDATYFELFDAQRPAERILRCAVRDDGSFSIPAELLGEVALPGSKQLALEGGRLRQFAFSARGLDTAELQLSTNGRTILQLQ